MSIRRSKKRTNLINEARVKACISHFDSSAYTRVQFLRAMSHSVGAHAVPEDRTADSDAEDDDEVRNDSDSDQPQSTVSEPQSQDYARCVWCSSATHDLLSCRAGTSVSVLPASHSLSNYLAVAKYAALTSAWSCVCTSGSDMLLNLTMYCLRTIPSVFVTAFCIFFDLF